MMEAPWVNKDFHFLVCRIAHIYIYAILSVQNIIDLVVENTIIIFVYYFLERAFDRAFQFEDTLPSTPRDKMMGSSMGNTIGTAPPPPSTPSFTTIQSTLTTATPTTPHRNNPSNASSTKNNITSVVNASNGNNANVQSIVSSTPSNFHHPVLSDANSMLARNLR